MTRPHYLERLLDRLPVALLAQPLEMALALALVINGIRQVFGEATPSVADLPPAARNAYMGISILAGIGLAVGLLMRTRPYTQPRDAPIDFGAAIERAFLFVVAGSYFALAVAILGNNAQRGMGQIVTSVVFGLACLARARAIRRTTRVVIEAVRNGGVT